MHLDLSKHIDEQDVDMEREGSRFQNNYYEHVEYTIDNSHSKLIINPGEENTNDLKKINT